VRAAVWCVWSGVCVCGGHAVRQEPNGLVPKGRGDRAKKHTQQNKTNKQTQNKNTHSGAGGRSTVIEWHDTCIVALSGWLLGAARKRPRKRAKTRNHHRATAASRGIPYSLTRNSPWLRALDFCFQKRSTSIGSENIPPHHTLAHTACTHVGPMEERLATTCVCRRGSEGTDLAGHHQPTTEPLDANFFEK
jgi:hypothetical protein